MASVESLSGVAVFVAAARAGSFTEAGERLGITKSAVGKGVAKLEERLGFKLFHRTTRITKLTADGEAYFAACAGALDEIAAAESALSSRNQVLSGRVHVDMPVAFGRRVLLPLLLEIVRPHPALTLTMTFTDATTDLFAEDIDVAIRFGALEDATHLTARLLATQRRVLCASPEYLRTHGVPRSIGDLRAHRGVVGSANGPPLTWVVKEGGSMKRVTPPATHRLSDGEALVEAAAGGLGICQMPISLVRHHLERGLLVSILDELSTVPIQVHAVWRREAHLRPRVRHVVDRLVEYAAEGRLS